MALIKQWHSRHPWVSEIMAAIVAGSTGLASTLPWFSQPLARGAICTANNGNWEHPLRSEIVSTLESFPGIHFRELQRQLDTANGTLRHHLDVLIRERTVTLVPVNGRTCYYAGAPAQVEILEGTGVTDEATAAAMLPVGLSDVQSQIVTMLSNSPNPTSQAQLARDMGKSRTTVNSAIGILRSRGIVNQGTLSLASHLDGLGMSKVDYPWLEIRQEYA